MVCVSSDGVDAPDPFGRLLIAQTQVVGLPTLSADRQLAAYDVQAHWTD
jgi:PIN domain nuclease of toxin-antitoxin system